MKLTEASKLDIQEMHERLSKRREERRFEVEIDQAISMVRKRPFVKMRQKHKIKMNEKNLFKAMDLLSIAFAGVLMWNMTENYFCLLFFFVVSAMATVEFKKSFT